jgi:hypothetical protein
MDSVRNEQQKEMQIMQRIGSAQYAVKEYCPGSEKARSCISWLGSMLR